MTTALPIALTHTPGTVRCFNAAAFVALSFSYCAMCGASSSGPAPLLLIPVAANAPAHGGAA